MDYVPDKSNSLAMDGHYGKCPKNLVSRAVSFSLPLSGDSSVETYNYTFDEKGRVATLIMAVKSTWPPSINDDAKQTDSCVFTYY
jgi:hypothetical protein